ncbi:MAG: methylmalonyl-CoA mutase family protein, partial [Bdellovibrionales bacterium]|nr:methylmalonyl-CoA mutase family protein [Bdellovibrionales bacterium]
MSYKAKHPIRIVTAASLFDGHDASINIMRRMLQDLGAEVIHLGHNRSVQDVVKAVLQEGAQGVAISSYQGGHMEYFKYVKDLLLENGAGYVKIFGGGGGVIIHEEKAELEAYGITQIFHPDDGRRLGLEGMIEFIICECDFLVDEIQNPTNEFKDLPRENFFNRDLGLAINAIENGQDLKPFRDLLAAFRKKENPPLVVGITGTGGAGKSSLIDELVQRFLNHYDGAKVAVVCVDPTKSKTGGALLGDRIRMNSLERPNCFMRSLASRGSGSEISKNLPEVLNLLKTLDFDMIIAESSGIGQNSKAILDISDVSLYVMTSEFGAQSQLEKIEMIDYADIIAINKADHRGADDAHRDVVKQYKRSRKMFEVDNSEIPVFLTQASNFNDEGVNQLFLGLMQKLKNTAHEKTLKLSPVLETTSLEFFKGAKKQKVVPSERQNYLAEIVHKVRNYKNDTEVKAQKLTQLRSLELAHEVVPVEQIQQKIKEIRSQFSSSEMEQLENFEGKAKKYFDKEFVYSVRGREIKQPLSSKSLCGLDIPRVVPPKLTDWGDRYRFIRLENFP